MSNSARYPTKIEEVNIYFGNTIPYISKSLIKARLGITDAKLLIVTNDYVLYKDNRDLYIDKSTKTSFIVSDNLIYIRNLKVGLNSIFKDIPSSSLLQLDRDTLLIFEPISGTSIPVADYSPKLVLETSPYLLMNLAISNPNTPNSSAMPHGQKVFLESFIGDAGLADADIPFTNGTNVSTAKHTIIFKLADVGKTCYARCFYENGHHQRGPQSTIVSKVVS